MPIKYGVPGIQVGNDYDTIWTVTFDSSGNVTVDNKLCEDIDTTALPATTPQF